MKRIIIAGGGIGGLCTAIALHKRGFAVQVYENAPDIKPLGAGIVLAANAIKALDKIGISEPVIRRGKSLHQFRIMAESGKIITNADNTAVNKRFGYIDNFTIHRADLHEVLLQHLPEGIIHLGKRCVDVVQDEEEVTVHFADGTQTKGDALIASDGIHSIIRQKFIPDSAPRYAGYTCWRGVVDTAPEGFDDTNATETWGSKGRAGIVPLNDGRIYWFVCMNASRNDPQMAKMTAQDIARIFSNYHFPIPQVLTMTPQERVIWSDIMDVKPIQQFAFGNVALLGDAAHATTPNMGQGACQAIEDAIVLANCLASYDPIATALKAYESRRIKRTTAIVNRSWQIGQLAQLENKWLASMRNTVLRMIPASMNEKQVAFLYNVDF